MAVRHVELAIEQRRFKTTFEFFAALRLEFRIAVRGRHERRLIFVSDVGIVEPRRIERTGLRPSRAPGRTQTQLLHVLHLPPERFFADHPRAAQLGIVRRLEVLTERAVVVAADGRRHEYAVVPRRLLFHIQTERGVREVVFRARERGATADGRDRNRREVGARRRDRAYFSPVVLKADGRFELEVLATRVLRDARVVERQVVRGGALHTLTPSAERPEQAQAAERIARIQQRVVLGVVVHTQHEPMRKPGRREVVGRNTERGAVVVGAVRHRLFDFWRRRTEAALRQVLRERRTPHQIAERIDRERPLHESDARANVRRTRRDFELVRQEQIEVGSQRQLAAPVPRDHATVVIPADRIEIPRRVGAAAYADVVALPQSRTEDGRMTGGDFVIPQIEVDEVSARVLSVQQPRTL